MEISQVKLPYLLPFRTLLKAHIVGLGEQHATPISSINSNLKIVDRKKISVRSLKFTKSMERSVAQKLGKLGLLKC